MSCVVAMAEPHQSVFRGVPCAYTPFVIGVAGILVSGMSEWEQDITIPGVI